MKKITLVVPDTFDLAQLLTVATGATSVNVETMLEPVQVNNKPKRTHLYVPGMDTRQAIMKHYLAGGFFSKQTAMKWMKEAGFNETSTSPAISRLITEGYITRSGTRVNYRYDFIKPMEKRADDI